MERNPNWRGGARRLRQGPVHQVRQPGRRRAGAATSARSTSSARSSPSSFEQLGEQDEHRDEAQRHSPSFTQLAFNLCSKQHCPDAKFNPAVQDRDGPPGDRLRGRPQASERDRDPRTPRSSATGSCPRTTRPSTRRPSRTTLRPRQGEPDARRRRLDARARRRPRRRTARRSRSTCSCARSRPYNIQAAKLIAEQAQDIGVEFKVQVVSVDKLTSSPSGQVDGKPAPDFDTFIWGWGGDPYDPSSLLSCSPPTRSAAPRTRSTRTPSTTSSSTSSPAISTPRSARS